MKAKIYRIYSDSHDKVYYGSTTRDLNVRYKEHRRRAKRTYFETSSKYVFQAGGNIKIECVEEIEADSRHEINLIEGKYIKDNNCVNKVISGRTKKVYYLDNKDDVKKYQDKYYQKNKENICNRKKKMFTCDCGRTLRYADKSRHTRSLVHKKWAENIISL